MTPIAAMTNNSSSMTGTMVFSLFISFTVHDLSGTGSPSLRPAMVTMYPLTMNRP